MAGLTLTCTEAQLAQIGEAIASFLHEREVERFMAEEPCTCSNDWGSRLLNPNCKRHPSPSLA